LVTPCFIIIGDFLPQLVCTATIAFRSSFEPAFICMESCATESRRSPPMGLFTFSLVVANYLCYYSSCFYAGSYTATRNAPCHAFVSFASFGTCLR